MKKNTKLRLSAVGAGLMAAALALGAASPAFADPSGFKQIVGVGSDTTQDVVGGLASAITNMGSYDALGLPALIQTRSGEDSFTRPNGSGSGQIALSLSATGGSLGGVDMTGLVDFARSSSGPSGSLSGSDLTFIPFARDAVSYAVSAASDFPRDIPLGAASQDSISPAPFTLRNIYRSTVTTYVNSSFQTITIRPLVPQTGSGTRSFWITQVGLTEGTLGSTVTDLTNSVQEHNGTFVTRPGDIVPFSVAQYIAQGNHAALPTTIAERRGNIVLGNIGSVKPYVPSTGGGIELNSSFPVNRLVFNVVQTARLSGGSADDVALQTMFSGTGSQVCSNATIIKQYGFGTIGTLCGNTTTYKQAYKFS